MTNHVYTPKGVCARQISFDLDDENRIHNLSFVAGCNGNLKAIGRLLEGADARQAADTLKGNLCANKGTSCADQLSRAIYEVLGQA